MNLRRAAIVAVTVWVAVVLVGSTMVWAVISRAGREVIAVTDAPVDPASSAASPRHKPGHSGSGRPSSHPSHRHSQRPDGSASPSGGASQPSGTESSAGGQPGSSHTSHPGGGQTSAPPPPGPDPRRDTWSGRGGTVMLECTGPKVTDVSAYPNAGYRYVVEDKTSSSLEVKFVGSDEEHEVEVYAYCQGGTPHFRADDSGGETEDEHGD